MYSTVPHIEFDLVFSSNSFARPKSDPYMSISIQQDVLRLQISVHNSIGMEMGYSRHDFSSVDACKLLPKQTLLVELEEKMAPIYEVQHKVKSMINAYLKGVPQLYNKRMINFSQYISLCFHVLSMVLLQNLVLPHNFHCVYF
ncbi:Os03g0334050 [Oryza sativa Japonica Group]|uniref:Os03g0334050 protein n=1 Tax=Oryza sativa subsp. japonica TaxID=39947 RepID=A0A0P0VY12_ORYSJ|nr:hypothetical protein EE612_017236 [Oryza sativa]BAS84063.1 Os03g0334050 [Oryza sativa Japonica Group]